jgi:AraC family ethanolamine operon transcriptional activator
MGVFQAPSKEAAVSIEISSRSRKFESLEDIRGSIRDTDAEFIPTGDQLKGRSISIDLGDVQFASMELSGGVRTRGAQLGYFSLGVQIRRTGLVSQWDLELEPGDVVVMPPGIERDGCSIGEAHFAMVTLYSGTLAALGGPDVTKKEMWLVRRPQRYRPEPKVAEEMVRTISRLLRFCRNWQPTSREQVELLKKRLLIPYLLGLASDTLRPAEVCVATGPSIIRRAEDWIEMVEPERLNVLDLSGALGIPLRTLQRTFQAQVGLGPVSYLRRRRLVLARRALLGASPEVASVTQIAMDHGFWDLGRFSVAYHRVFGEKPSTTLRRFRRSTGQAFELDLNSPV